jgi:hypothetical protein
MVADPIYPPPTRPSSSTSKSDSGLRNLEFNIQRYASAKDSTSVFNL